MLLGIHQPEHLGWLGLYNKIYMSDKFVLLDNVPFRKNYFQNRNKIKGSNGSFWLTVPIKKHSNDTLIKDIQIDNSTYWQESYLKSIISSYRKSPYFTKYFNSFSEIFDRKETSLSDLNEKIIRHFMEQLGIKKELIKASELNVSGHKSELLLNICKKTGYDTYLSGVSGRDYLDLDLFKKNNIKIIFQDFKHPTYPQQWGDFIPNLSILDLLFNSKCPQDYINSRGLKNE